MKTNESNLRIFRFICLITLLILVISLFWLGTKSEWVSLFPVDPPIDKLAHLLVFSFISVLLWFSSLNPRPFIVFVMTAMVGVADELHQYYIPERTASFADFSADFIGIIITIVILSYTQRKPATATSSSKP